MSTAFFVGIFAVFFAYLVKKGFSYGLEVSMAILTVFVAIRYEWGTDMPTYLVMYDMFSESGYRFWEFSKISSICYRSNEVGWGVFNILCKPVGFFGMIIILAIIENFIIYDTIKKYVSEDYYWLAIFLYAFNADLMVLGCSMIRQWLAMCIVLLAARYVLSGNIYKFVLLIAFASIFHQSAVIFILLYLVRYIDRIFVVNFKNIIIVIAIALGYVFVIGKSLKVIAASIINSSFFDYEVDDFSKSGSTVGQIVMFTMFILLLCLALTQERNKEERLLCWMSCMYIIIVPLAPIIPLAGRLLYYSGLLAMISIPISIKYLNNKTIKAVLVFVLIFQQLYLYNIFFQAESYFLSYKEYHTIFESLIWM